ncbi:Zinc finger FYVE domain-containing protein 26 [Chelonia mydas]|uniref:Zinc finger FYVE domain-containing protein 26 n=1 Tax=Chelonia mydas TaxID=8469 RepID=M7BSV3_CHEMY|nr:Zinc finger FYVE domain-containing protein 26 [Chelonia mydas]
MAGRGGAVLRNRPGAACAVLQRETEFLLLLEELQKDVSDEVLKELFEAFECVQSKHESDRKKRDGRTYRFSVEATSALRKLLLRAPRRAQALLEFLQAEPGTPSSAFQHSCCLQNIYVDFLRDSLKSLQRLQRYPKSSGELDQSETVDAIYSALSVLHFEVEHQTGELRHLCRELLDACWAEGSPLKEERLLGCILRKQSHALLCLYSNVFTERTREKLLGPKLPGKGSSEQLETERVMLALFSEPEEVYSWKTAYFYCLSSSKHFLEQILGLCSDSVLKEFCDGLWAQVEVLEWCTQQNSITIPKKILLQHLYSLDCHSALYSLHHLTNLLALNEEDVIELLQKVPARDQQTKDCPAIFPQYLAKCQQFLRRVPAPLHLELLENIFSLLFVSYSDLYTETPLLEDYAEEDDIVKKSCGAGNLDGSASRESSTSESPQHPAEPERKAERHPQAPRTVYHDTQTLLGSELSGETCESSRLSYLDLKHFASGVSGFLVDDLAVDAFLKMLLNHLQEIQSSLPWDSSNVPHEELELVECLNFSVNRDVFGSRVLQFSKYLSEAQWRYKVVMSNRNTDCKEGTSSQSLESTSSELSTSTSEGSTSTLSGWSDLECRLKPQQQNLLIPMMLSPPESLLVSCILRGNFIEAHQVALMFNLESSACYGELVFGSAAAAGMVFYSISDVTDKLLATSGSLVPTLQENFWTSSIQLEHTDPMSEVVADLSPSAMAAFDLACTQCHQWKTCKQLLETAERRLHNSFETREVSDEKISNQFRCNIVDLLQMCYPTLTEDCIANQIALSQHLDQVLQTLTDVEDSPDPKGSLITSLVEQASLKPTELEAHPVRNQIQLLLKTLDQHIQTMPVSSVRTDCVKSFFDYINTLAAVVLRSLNTELGDVSIEKPVTRRVTLSNS